MNAVSDPFPILLKAAQARPPDLVQAGAWRLFNGFYEGIPGIVLDCYGSALVIFDYGEPGESTVLVEAITQWAMEDLTGVDSVLLKQRQNPDERYKNGILLAGEKLPTEIVEQDIRYALDLQMNQDAGFYLDTRYLRQWLVTNMAGRSLLNTFAYTGSLGAAAGAGFAKGVVQTDLSEKFMEIGSKSWELNELEPKNHSILSGDFFRVIGKMRNEERLFDGVILDPPYFSTTEAGRVDLQAKTTRLINKVRPLVAHEGWLVVINNALFLSGEDFRQELEHLCESPYLSFEAIIPVPLDVTGYPDTVVAPPPADPAPFNHPTKIAVLKVTRKDERR